MTDLYKHGGLSSDTAKNIGTSQASQGQTSSPQQANESAALYQQRQAAYDAQKAAGKK